MNFPFFQQCTNWTAPLGSFIEQWRLIGLVSFLLLLTNYLLPYLWVYYKKEQLYRRLPSPVTSPILGRILGNLELYWNTPAEMKRLPPTVLFYRLIQQLVSPFQDAGESVFLFRLGPFRKYVMVINSEVAKAVLSSSKHLEKATEYFYLKDYIDVTLLSGTLPEWKVLRKLLEPAFHLKILKTYLPAMNVHSEVLCSVIALQMDPSTGQALLVDIRPLSDNCILDILCETTMGVTLNCQTEGNNYRAEVGTPTAGQLFNDFLSNLLHLACLRVTKPWLYPSFLYRLSGLYRKTTKCLAYGRHFTNSVISKRKLTLSKQIEDCATVEQATARLTDGSRLSFLDLLLVNHMKGGENALNLNAIEDEVLEILMGGFNTTSNTLQMALVLLGLHYDKQALIHEELDAIFADDDERDISLEDLRQMMYLEMCIKETLRLYPGVNLAGRTLSEDMQMDKYLIPEGTSVYVNIGAINRDPQVWTNANKFLPERFSLDSTVPDSSRGNLFFSVGARNCLGNRFAMLNLKIVLAFLLRQYSVRSLTSREDVQLGTFIITKVNSPISIEFTKRK